MKKKAEENVYGPFREGLSVFRMNFATKGLSWAEKVYQKWENIHLDNLMSQDPSKYVDAFGEQLRKICEEVADDWLGPYSDDCVKGPVSDLSLEHDVIAEVCKKHKIGLNECPVSEKSADPSEWEPSVFSGEDLSLASLPDSSQDACPDMLIKTSIHNSIEVNEYCCLDEGKENHEKVSDPVALVANLSGKESSICEVSLSKSTEDKVVERCSMLSSCTSLTQLRGALTSQETMSLVESFGNEYEQQSKPNELEASLPGLNIGSSDHFVNESTEGHGTITANTEPLEEFEDVKLEDYWDDPEKNELALLLQRMNKKMSYKKKLRDALTSKVRSSKKNHVRTTMGIAPSSPASSMVLKSKTLSTQDSCESDWELL